MGRPLTWLDVFTSVPLAGNGLCVVHDADDLDEVAMLAIARETRLSETTFVQTATQGGADYRNRIFTLHGELPFAGHPSLGTAVAVARARGQARASYVQQTHAGLQPVDVTLDGVNARASMLQNPAVFGPELDPARVLAAVGLDPGEANAAWPPQLVSTGVPHVVTPVRDVAALARARADETLLPALLDELGAICVYVAAVDSQDGAGRARSFFMGDAGTLEDPATGSAVGPLLAYVAERAGVHELTVGQGAEIGRPSTLHAAVEGDRVRVTGNVVVVAEGTAL
jgi:trans-2,3-dihydro-3-hydroxyanthranilate isomerase